MNKNKNKKTFLIGIFFVFIGLLACAISADDLPTQEQIEGGIATAQAVGEQASDFATRTAPTLQAAAEQAVAAATNIAPTLQAAAANASDLATRTAPTIVALQTQAVVFATESAPTLEAGIEQLATAAVDAQANAASARATLDAAGIDGNYLRQKVAGLRPDENGNINATFTETEVNLVLQWRQSETLENGAEVTMQNPSVQFTNGTAIYRARVTTPVEGDLTLVMQPFVSNGVLQLSLVAADLSGQTVPPFMLTLAENSLNSTLNGAFSQLPGNVSLTAVYVNEGSLTFLAMRNG